MDFINVSFLVVISYCSYAIRYPQGVSGGNEVKTGQTAMIPSYYMWTYNYTRIKRFLKFLSVKKTILTLYPLIVIYYIFLHLHYRTSRMLRCLLIVSLPHWYASSRWVRTESVLSSVFLAPRVFLAYSWCTIHILGITEWIRNTEWMNEWMSTPHSALQHFQHFWKLWNLNITIRSIFCTFSNSKSHCSQCGNISFVMTEP